MGNNNNKNSKTLKGGYISSLTGVNQSERAESYKLSRRGAGIQKDKKKEIPRKNKHRKSNDNYY